MMTCQTSADVIKESVNHAVLVIGRFGFQRIADAFHTQFVEIQLFESTKFTLFHQIGIFRPQKVESLIVQDLTFGPFKPDESTQQRLGTLCHEVQFLPQPVQCGILFVVQHLLHQRSIIAEKTFNQMKARRQASAFIDVVKAIGERLTKRFRCQAQVARRRPIWIDQKSSTSIKTILRRFTQRSPYQNAAIAAVLEVESTGKQQMPAVQFQLHLHRNRNFNRGRNLDDKRIRINTFTDGIETKLQRLKRGRSHSCQHASQRLDFVILLFIVIAWQMVGLTENRLFDNDIRFVVREPLVKLNEHGQ